MAIEVNKYQTQLSDELLDSLHPEVRDELLEVIANVKFIQRLISPDRKYARNLERDSDGKIIVDLLNPHILEDMDYFRQTAICYEKHGVLTQLRPNANANSDYMRWLRTEIERIWFGMVRPSDGEWVTGEMYWYLNYVPIIKDEISEDGMTADRIEGFPDSWEGVYLWFHYLHQARKGGIYNNFRGGQHGVQIAKRGASKSYSIGAILSRLFVVGDGPKNSRKTRGILMAYDKEKLVKDGTLNKFVEAIDFQSENTQFAAARLKSTLDGMQWKMGYKDKLTGTEKGTLNEIIGVASNDDPDKARGKRGLRFIYEEFGAFPKFIDVWNVNRRSVQNGNVAFGQAIAIGTGGSEGNNFYGALQMIYSPRAYNVYALPNVFDRGANGEGTTVFFFGAYLNRATFMNHDGVSDVTGALIEILQDRFTIKYNATDTSSLTRAIAEDPITIQEAIMRRDSSIYPAAYLQDRQNEIKQNPKILNEIYVGMFKEVAGGKIEFDPTADVMPIRYYPHKDNKLHGAVEIHKMPEKDSKGQIFSGRYIAGIDPYDDDTSMTLSLGSIIVLDLWTDRIVAEYTGRPQFADEFYEICRRMLIFYNAQANYENNKKGIFGYFSKKNSLYLLTDVLDYLKDKDMIRGQLYGNKAHPYSQLVPTLDGWKKWSQIQIGDYLFDAQGGYTKVIDIPFDNETDIYRITLQDGRSVFASLNHLWNVIDWNGCNKIVSTNDLITGYRQKGKYRESKYYIPNNKAVLYRHQDISIDPYILGLALGDGCFTQTTLNQLYFTSSEEDMNTYKKYFNTEIKQLDNRHYRVVIPDIKIYLTQLGLEKTKSRSKFIPRVYKENTTEVRLNLLRGLMDTDGRIGYGGNPEFCTTSLRLAQDVMELSRSLGINCNMNTSHNKFGDIFKIRFYSSVRLFNLERKYSKQKLTKTRNKKTAIINVEFSHRESAKCVTVDSKDSCYLVGDFITTHNSKGTIASVPIQNYGRRDIRDWLLKEVAHISVDENGEETITVLPNLTTLQSTALIEELIQWNPENNYDRHDALLMLMLLRQDKLRLMGDRRPEDVSRARDTSYLGNDPFFKKNGPKKNVPKKIPVEGESKQIDSMDFPPGFEYDSKIR